MTLHNQKGATLIELMTAVFILSVALVGALELTTSNVRNQGLGVSRLVALNLAREGIEVARNTRDTSWLSERAWDTYLPNSAGESTVGACAILRDGGMSLDAGENPFAYIDAPCTSESIVSEPFAVYRSETGAYYQTVDAAIENERAPQLYRMIEMQSVCLVNGSERQCASFDESKIAVAVTSRVTWRYGGRMRDVTFVEKIYDWR